MCSGLVEPLICKMLRCVKIRPMEKKGKKKCRLKNLLSVGFATEYPPQSHWVIISPHNGITENKLVMTVAAHKDI
jgi:hypothetical protein